MEEGRLDRRRGLAFWIIVVAIAVAGTAISILASSYTRQSILQFDENYYFPLAQQITEGSYVDGYIIRPPLYPLFLAGFMKIIGTGFTSLLVVASVIRGLLIVGIAYMGRRFFSERAGVIAAILLTVYPLLIWTYTRFMTEAIYVPLFLISFYLIDRALGTGRKSHWLIAGFFSGLASLARSTSLVFTLVIAVWLVLRKTPTGRFSRANIVAAVLLVVALLVTISPWMIRNAVVHKALIPVDNAAAFNLYLITSGQKIKDAEVQWTAWGTHAERQKEGYRRWREYLKGDPAFHLKRIGTVIPRLFSPLRHPSTNSLSVIRRGVATRQNMRLKGLLTVIVPIVFWTITAGGVIGLGTLERNRSRRMLVIITIAYFILIHAMTLARPRFLLPMNAVLAVYAGALIGWALSRLGWTRRSRP
jgi:4-amino-4-deoxy-L-arabinose transferase-like glycosyltransferase